MIVLGISANLPETLWGWVAVIGGVVAIILSVGGIVVATARAHINRRVDTKLEESVGEAVKESVEACMAPVIEKIDGIRINQRENSESQMRAMARIEKLEVTINNGLTSVSKKTNEDVEELKVSQSAMQKQISEMHGWMKVITTWDGTDRRGT